MSGATSKPDDAKTAEEPQSDMGKTSRKKKPASGQS